MRVCALGRLFCVLEKIATTNPSEVIGGIFLFPPDVIKGDDLMTIQAILHEATYLAGNTPIFQQVSAKLKKGGRIGLIGRNGSGKSTLLQIIAGELELSSGSLSWEEAYFKIKFVRQEEAEFSSTASHHLEEKLLMKWQVPKDVSFAELSGGEKLKRRLAEAFSTQADILLLDEPTNHLDEAGIEELLKQLEQFKGTTIIVSHDRAFLDRFAQTIWSLEQGGMVVHNGNYTSYRKQREKEREDQRHHYTVQQQKINRIHEQISELQSWSQKAHRQSTKKDGFKEYYRVKAKKIDQQIKSKRKQLEKELAEKKIERVIEDTEVKFTLEASKKVGKRFLEVRDLSKRFNERVLFEKASFTIKHGDKMAIRGKNGAGKTTLLQIIAGHEGYEGGLWVSPSANVGYLTQSVFDLPLQEKPESVFYTTTFEERAWIQNTMKHLGFTSKQWQQPIANMSMGERVKLKLMAFILEEKDVLILDEPTNHLDLPSREQLEDTLSKYNGTLIVVSHDNYFVDRVTNQNLWIGEGTIHQDQVQANNDSIDYEQQLMKLETERQYVLGKLSMLAVKDSEYAALDQLFNELSKEINKLRQQIANK
ncbi:putative ABC transporter ATP-binding protein YheS [compost metagenome]